MKEIYKYKFFGKEIKVAEEKIALDSEFYLIAIAKR